MKEKVTIAIMLSFLIGIMWIGNKNEKSPRIDENLSEITAPAEPEYNHDVTLDELLPEVPSSEASGEKLDYSEMNNCALELPATDGLTFSEAFGYFRLCLGQDSVFSWNGKKFTTALAGDETIQLADSSNVEDPPEEELQGSDSAATH